MCRTRPHHSPEAFCVCERDHLSVKVCCVFVTLTAKGEEGSLLSLNTSAVQWDRWVTAFSSPARISGRRFDSFASHPTQICPRKLCFSSAQITMSISSKASFGEPLQEAAMLLTPYVVGSSRLLRPRPNSRSSKASERVIQKTCL
jgi:hypothetical protein